MQGKPFTIQKACRLLLLLLFPILALCTVSNTCAAYQLQQMDRPLRHAGTLGVNSPWGEKGHRGHVHMGIDFTADEWEPIYAVAPGTVEWAGWYGGGGPTVIIQHDTGWKSVYMDMQSSMEVSPGQPVKRGEEIGYVGGVIYDPDTGQNLSSGSHLHFEIRTEPNYPSSPTLCPYAYFIYAHDAQGNWLSPNAVDPSYVTSSKSRFSATYDFTGPVKKVIDKITTACSQAIKLLEGIIRSVIVILMVIDLSLDMMMTTVDSGKSGEPGPPVLKLFIVKCAFYGLLFAFIVNWSGFLANGLRDFFVTNGAVAANSTYDAASKLVSNPFDIVTRGAKLIAPLFEIIDYHAADSFSITQAMTFWFNVASIIPALFFMFIIFGCYCLLAIQVAISMLEFYLTIVFSFSSFMFSGWKYTRQFAQTGVSAIFAVTIKLFFYCFFATLLLSITQGITVGDLVQKDADIATWKATAHPNGDFKSPDEVEAAILIVETGGREDAYITPSSDGYGFGAWQISYTNWANWYEKALGVPPATDRLMPYPEDSPAWVSYGVRSLPYDGDWHNVYGKNGEEGVLIAPAPCAWTQQEQDAIGKWCIETLWEETGGDVRKIAQAWNGDSTGAYYKKLCEAQGSIKRKGPKLLLPPLILLSIICVLLVLIGDRVSSDITRNFGKGGFKFLNN